MMRISNIALTRRAVAPVATSTVAPFMGQSMSAFRSSRKLLAPLTPTVVSHAAYSYGGWVNTAQVGAGELFPSQGLPNIPTAPAQNHFVTAPNGLKLSLPPHRYAFRPDTYRMPHMTYETQHLETSKVPFYNTHREPQDWADKAAKGLVTFARRMFDLVTGYNKYNHDLRGVASPSSARGGPAPLMPADRWLIRAIFLETVAAVPGMVAGMLRHMRSLRIMKKDDGWIHALLEEAENERMHLFFFLKEKNPGIFFRMMIAGAQGIFFFFNVVGYLISPRFMHRFVGYIEEEACHTYTIILEDIDRGLDAAIQEAMAKTATPNPYGNKNLPSSLPSDHISHWRTKPAPKDYVQYYDLQEGATFRDVVLCIRADELSHREHNHMYADAHVLKAESHVSKLLHEVQPLTILSQTITNGTETVKNVVSESSKGGDINGGGKAGH